MAISTTNNQSALLNSYINAQKAKLDNVAPMAQETIVQNNDTFEKITTAKIEQADTNAIEIKNKGKLNSTLNKENFKEIVSFGIVIAWIVAMFSVCKSPKQINMPETPNKALQRSKNIWIDIKDALKIEDMSLPKEMQKILDRIKAGILDSSAIKDRGGKNVNTILLYGPPGTGKTTFAKAIAKYFPDSEFAALDLTNLSSKWVNESEKNIQSAVEEICEQAKSNPEKKFFVFIDEIDSVMMIHEGSSSAFHSNSVLNEFKRCFTDKLGAHENIVTIAATNLEVIDKNPMGKKLDKAMLDRFQEKIYIPLPTKEQLLSAITKHYNNCSKVQSNLKNPEDKTLVAFVEFIKNNTKNFSFRTLNTIFDKAANSAYNQSREVAMTDLFEALKDLSKELDINPMALNKFINSYT